MTDGPDPYKVLQVDSEAEDEVIQAAFRRLARKYHPDVAPGPEAAARMAAINAAWELLRDPARRAVLDRDRASAARAAAPPSPPPDSPFPWPEPTAASGPRQPPPPETTASNWTSGRSSHGGGYDPARMGTPDGLGAAGPPPGNPSGSVLTFGRYAEWSIGEIARRDVEYLEWLDRMPIGRPYRDEIDVILRRTGRRQSAASEAEQRRGLFRRR